VATDDKVTVAVEEEITVNVVVETAADEGGTKVVGTADAAPDVVGSSVVAMADAVPEETEINVVGIAVVPFEGLVPAWS
jgi:hypothetical protein